MRIILLFSFVFIWVNSLFAENLSAGKSLLELGEKTGKEYVKYRNDLCNKKIDLSDTMQLNSQLPKAMCAVIYAHLNHKELCDTFLKDKERIDRNLKGIVSYTRGYSSFVGYIIKRREKKKKNSAYKEYLLNLKLKVENPMVDSEEDFKVPDIISNPPAKLNDEDKSKLKYMKNNPKYFPLSKAEKLKEMERVSCAKIRLLEYALKETEKPHELYSILLLNQFIEPEKKEPHYKEAKALYNYLVMRYIYNLDIILSEMEKRDERLRKVYEGKPRYMYTVEKALNLLDKNKLYGTISLLEALRKHFEVNPKKNKIIINAINKKIEEFRTKNAKEIQWSDVFERVNPM